MRARELDKMLRRESLNLTFAVNRLVRLNADEDVTEFDHQRMIELMELNNFINSLSE